VTERNTMNPTGLKSYAALAALSDDLHRIVNTIAPRVVTIDSGRRRRATGTVWIDGILVTAAHVLRDTDNLRVTTAEGKSYEATFGGWDLVSDLAVLKVDGLPRADRETEDEQSPPGVYDVGHLAVVVAGGRQRPVARLTMIASVRRVDDLRRGTRLGHVIELDLAPFPGYSGGPLVDTSGVVIGINTAGLVRGGAFAVPIDFVGRVVDELLTYGRVARGYLGVGTQPVRITKHSDDRKDAMAGFLINALEAGGPAEQAGILVGDILLNLDGALLDSPGRLLEELGDRRAGDGIRLIVRRGGQDTEINVIVGERPQRAATRCGHGH
jgi:S1-C subfamily serine protease